MTFGSRIIGEAAARTGSSHQHQHEESPLDHLLNLHLCVQVMWLELRHLECQYGKSILAAGKPVDR
jgi:hypothetical protein